MPPPLLPGQLDKDGLAGALGEWCANAADAEETHGHISMWDVSAVTDMSQLIFNGPGACRHTFDEDVNAWDVGQVTNMEVRRGWRIGMVERIGWRRPQTV